MIQKVSFRNFKAYRSLDLDLEPFTVLVGPNASGKTTLLQGLHSAVRQRFPASPDGQTALKSFGATGSLEWGFSGVWNGTQGHLRVTLMPGIDEFDMTGKWAGNSFSLRSDGSREGLAAERRFDTSFNAIRAALKSTAVLRFEAQALSAASYSEALVPEVRESGSGLASVLAYLKLSQDEVFDDIEQALKQIVPSVRRIRIERAAVERTALRTLSLDEQRHQISEQQTLWGNRIILDMRGAKGVAADSIGEGTLMVLGLLTVLMGPNKPRLVLLDDIELNLHPVAQGLLIETLRKLQARDPELQIVATSHSPFILNYLKPEEVRMTFLSENGFARCEKLTAHPDFERWKDLMSPGEFWSTVGESWVAKAGATESNE